MFHSFLAVLEAELMSSQLIQNQMTQILEWKNQSGHEALEKKITMIKFYYLHLVHKVKLDTLSQIQDHTLLTYVIAINFTIQDN